MASTQKAQTLNEEVAEFNKLVEDDLKAADVADEDAEENEEESKLREAVSMARELESKLDSLKRRREAVRAREREGGTEH